ncbi:MAG: hypothetical protein KF862_12500 [Chitinophagaceae bacterium]|nr:hypothetical protein [Chitinophagaceae bacterium]
MKRILFFLSVLAGILLFASCDKERTGKIPTLTEVPLPLILKDPGGDQSISANPDTFQAKFSVDIYFKEDTPPQKFDIVIMKNESKGNVKVFKANVTSFPVSYEISGPELVELFGEPIVPGDKFDIGADVTTQDGQVYRAFPEGGVGYNANIGALAGASPAIRYAAPCKYVSEVYEGKFVVVTDEWGDYAEGDVVPVTRIDDTHFSFKYADINAQPIIVEVDPEDNSTHVAKQVYGDGYGAGYGPISCETVASPLNIVDPCVGSFTVRLNHTVSAGSFGEATITLKKQ